MFGGTVSNVDLNLLMEEYLSFEKLKVWKKAIDWSVSVIDIVERINCDRKHYRLVEQLEASASSVALNIAEGKGRYSQKEFRQYLYGMKCK